ncbi:DUF3316 domain-containing protein [Vibrio tritonius]|uniref:DUF3316 domain-containing protein n=1 Tax=Vibrio tritonius TaxID=1435069 RepID=A0ABS7YQW8_9VIBR|nr:DUF3316 domain-containing protein [Vibrio tritonius]MCA2018075.1 DUF3316 domain-containing protein [Vibrio tritonius]
MKKTIFILAAMTVSAGAFAAQTHLNVGETTIDSGVYSTKQEAYDAGLQKIHDLQQLPGTKLKNKLVIYNPDMVYGSTRLRDMEVKVEPFMEESGKTQYRSTVDVNYHYKVHESKNS